jgi:aminobutyraldehyde dehydrogenase
MLIDGKLMGGKHRAGAGFFFEPTVVAGALSSDEIVKRQVFGPVVTIARFTEADDAVALRWRTTPCRVTSW